MLTSHSIVPTHEKTIKNYEVHQSIFQQTGKTSVFRYNRGRIQDTEPRAIPS